MSTTDTDLLTNLANELESARNTAARLSRAATTPDEHDRFTQLAWSLDHEATLARNELAMAEQEHDDALLDAFGNAFGVGSTVSFYLDAHDEWRTEATVYAIIGDSVELRLFNNNGRRVVRPARQVSIV